MNGPYDNVGEPHYLPNIIALTPGQLCSVRAKQSRAEHVNLT